MQSNNESEKLLQYGYYNVLVYCFDPPCYHLHCRFWLKICLSLDQVCRGPVFNLRFLLVVLCLLLLLSPTINVS